MNVDLLTGKTVESKNIAHENRKNNMDCSVGFNWHSILVGIYWTLDIHEPSFFALPLYLYDICRAN